MKKILLVICLLAACARVSAQAVTFGIKAGLNVTELPASSQDGITVRNSYKTGFHAGAMIDVNWGAFSIQPAVLFTQKGGKTDGSISYPTEYMGQTVNITGTATGTTTLNYIEVPLNFLYRLNTGNGRFFIGGGPYIALGLSGKLKASATSGGVTTDQSQDIKFGNGDGEVQNPDFGLNGLLGYQLNSGLMISAGYGYGLVNSSNDNGKVKNKGFSFSLGYFFR